MAFQQVGGPSFQQLDDSSNPQAQAYARMALARNGIHVPHGADAAAMWRQFSQQRMLQRNAAMVQGPDANDAIDPNTPLGTGSTTSATAVPGTTPPGVGIDWHQMVQQLAARLPVGTKAPPMSEFQHVQGGPAEAASMLGALRLRHVNDAQQAAQKMASLLAARRPSKSFRRMPGRTGPRGY